MKTEVSVSVLELLVGSLNEKTAKEVIMDALKLKLTIADALVRRNIKATKKVLVLTDNGGSKLAIVKLIKDHTGLGLKESKELTDYLPVKLPIYPEDLKNVADLLKEAGATCHIEEVLA